MEMEVENFTPLSAAIGGALIGLSAVMLMALNGRVAGISGIFAGMAFADGTDRIWRILFVVGLVAGPVVYGLFLADPIPFAIQDNVGLLVAGGLLVGIGTRLGGGCTSGHGVCGIARFSPRSIAATMAFMVAGIATVAVIRGLM